MVTHPDLFAEAKDKFIWLYCVGWKTGMEEDDNKQVGTTELFVSHDNQTDRAQALQQAEKTWWHFNLYEDWMDLFEWQSVCYSFSMSKKHELVYANGKLIQGYKWSKEFRKGWGDNPMRLRQIYPEGGKWVIKDPYTGKIRLSFSSCLPKILGS